MTSLNYLPEEVVRLIVAYFTEQQDIYQCTLIGRQFYAVANPILWRAPSRKHPRDFFLSHTAFSVLGCLRSSPYSNILCSHIRKLHFKQGDSVQDIIDLVTFSHLLEDLALYLVDVHEMGIKSIALRCPRLQKLSLERLFMINDRCLSYFGEYCSQLRDLSLHGNIQLTPNCLSSLYRLERLDLADCLGLNGVLTAAHLAQFHRLTDLTVPDGIQSKFMRELLPCEQNERMVPLAGLTCFRVQDKAFQCINLDLIFTFLQTHPLLHTLDLNFRAVDDTFTTALANLLPNLTYLRIYQDEDAYLSPPLPVVFSRTCFFPLLRTLALDHCNIQGVFLPDLNLSMPKLECLELSFCVLMDPLALRQFLKNTTMLNHATFRGYLNLNHHFPKVGQGPLVDMNETCLHAIRSSIDTPPKSSPRRYRSRRLPRALRLDF